MGSKRILNNRHMIIPCFLHQIQLMIVRYRFLFPQKLHIGTQQLPLGMHHIQSAMQNDFTFPLYIPCHCTHFLQGDFLGYGCHADSLIQIILHIHGIGNQGVRVVNKPVLHIKTRCLIKNTLVPVIDAFHIQLLQKLQKVTQPLQLFLHKNAVDQNIHADLTTDTFRFDIRQLLYWKTGSSSRREKRYRNQYTLRTCRL